MFNRLLLFQLRLLVDDEQESLPLCYIIINKIIYYFLIPFELSGTYEYLNLDLLKKYFLCFFYIFQMCWAFIFLFNTRAHILNEIFIYNVLFEKTSCHRYTQKYFFKMYINILWLQFSWYMLLLYKLVIVEFFWQ